MDKRTLDDLLTAYGDVTYSEFTSTANGTRIAGFKFAIRLKPNKHLPPTITYNNFDMTIKLKDDIRHCTYCKRYGHTTNNCRARKQDDVMYDARRKDARLEQQVQYNHELTAVNETEMDAIQTLGEQYEKEMERLLNEHNANVWEKEKEGVTEGKLLLIKLAWENRKKSEAEEREEVERDLHSRYEGKRTVIKEEYPKMGFRLPQQSRDKETTVPLSLETQEEITRKNEEDERRRRTEEDEIRRRNE